MILDSYTMQSAVIQITFDNAFEIWDQAGAMARAMSDVWGGLKVADAQPAQQNLSGRGIFIHNGIGQCTITVAGNKALDAQNTFKIKQSFDVWKMYLSLNKLTRVSTRMTYIKDWDSMKDANAAILNMNLVRFPKERVFGQPMDSDLNGVDVNIRFQDDKSFTFLRCRAEHLNFQADLDPSFVTEPEIRVEKYRSIIDFDRGSLGGIDASRFQMVEWIEGCKHLLRRDIEKVIGAKS